ncbi:MAG: universal stress protein [Gammaproteobacteria bacterium]|nr:universal stress protein [Gammaproteobacteria bacterium]
MDQIRNVLAAAGQFPQDDTVLARATEIARAHRARLTIVHVIDDVSGFDLAPVDTTLIQHQLRLSAQEDLKAAIARVEIDVTEIDIRIEIGSPSLRLIELSNEINADLIVVRAHHSDSILEKIIGSTTDRVIRTSHVPVLVVKRPVTQAYQRIVVSIDTFDDSAVVAPFVAALFPLARLQLNHVVQITTQFEVAMQRAGSGQAGIAAHRDALIHKAKAFLRDLSQKLAKRPLRTVVRVVVGDPAASLVRATWSPKVDLIVLGPGSTGRIRWALLGSVTRRVLRAATCDVLICRTAQQDTKE